MRQDDNVEFRKRDEGNLGDFGESSPTNSFSGGETDHLFLSDGGEQFYDLDKLSGLAHPGDGRTACLFDYDRDGWADIVTASANSPTFQLYRNRIGESFHADAPGARVVALRFEGGNRGYHASDAYSSRAGYGAMVRLDVGDAPLIREHRCGDGRAARHSDTMLVGIGDAHAVERVTVRWPSGRVQQLEGVPVGTLVTVFENPADSPTGKAFVLEPYLKNVLAGRDLAGAAGATLVIDRPVDETIPALTVLTAMSTHCATCKQRQPQIRQLTDAFGEQQLRVYAVGTDLDEDEAALASYANEQTPAYEVLAGLPLEQRRAVRDHVRGIYGDDLTPVSMVTDATGRVLETFPGVPSVSDVKRLLATAGR